MGRSEGVWDKLDKGDGPYKEVFRCTQSLEMSLR